ncbi:MAG: hypothetical protein ACOCVM_01140 [Desulfovibrionaceae bacterium]
MTWDFTGKERQCGLLKDEHESAAKFRNIIGKDGEVKKSHYLEWTLFKNFRNTESLKEAFEKVFGEQCSGIPEIAGVDCHSE